MRTNDSRSLPLRAAWERLLGKKLAANEEEQRRLKKAPGLLEAIAACPCTDHDDCELVRTV